MSAAATQTSTTTPAPAEGEVSMGAPAEATGSEPTLGTPAPAPAQASDKPTEQAAPIEAPKPLELKLPEGWSQDDARAKEFATDAAALGLTAEKAQAFFDKHVVQAPEAVRESIASEVVDGVEAQVKEWQGALKADKEFGGAKFAENFELAKQGLEKVATPELKAFLYESGIGSHPEVVRLFYRLGKERAEDSSAGTGGTEAAPTAATDPATFHRTLYPTMFKQG